MALLDMFRKSDVPIVTEETTQLAREAYLKETSMETVVTYVSDRTSLVLFKSNDTGLEHRWNITPNLIQNGSEFKREIVKKLLVEGECLVIQDLKEPYYLYIADSFESERTGITTVSYTGIVVDGIEIPGKRTNEEVYHFKYKNTKLEEWTNKLNDTYADLFLRIIDVVMLQSQVRIYPKFKSMYGKGDDTTKKFNQFLSNYKKALRTEHIVVTPTQDDHTVEESKASYKGFNVDEVAKTNNMFLADVCRIFGISSALFDGSLADITQHRKDFVRFVNSITNIIATEINSKYFNGDKIETFKEMKMRPVLFYLEYNSIFEASKDIEKTIGSGVYTINDILEMQGYDKLDDEEIGTQRFMTRNIGSIEQALLEGGEVFDNNSNTIRGSEEEKSMG